MPNPIQTKMEDMSVAYLTALCANNGFTLMKEEHDNDGVDRTVKCTGKPSIDCKRKSPKLDVQLKSAYSPSNIKKNPDGSISFKLEVKNYNILVDTERITPIILVVLYMCEDENQWLEQTTDYLKIKKCAYWISLEGWDPSENKDKITITIPANHILSKESLHELMMKVANEEKL